MFSVWSVVIYISTNICSLQTSPSSSEHMFVSHHQHVFFIHLTALPFIVFSWIVCFSFFFSHILCKMSLCLYLCTRVCVYVRHISFVLDKWKFMWSFSFFCCCCCCFRERWYPRCECDEKGSEWVPHVVLNTRNSRKLYATPRSFCSFNFCTWSLRRLELLLSLSHCQTRIASIINIIFLLQYTYVHTIYNCFL